MQLLFNTQNSKVTDVSIYPYITIKFSSSAAVIMLRVSLCLLMLSSCRSTWC